MKGTGRWKAGVYLPVLLAVVILVAITPASAFTASLNTPTSVQPGDLISFSLGGLANNDVFSIKISSNNLVNTENSYRLENFSMPFGFQTGTSSLVAMGTNAATLSMHVKTATDEVTYTKSGGPYPIVTSSQDIHKKVYDLIEFSGTPYTAGSPVGVDLVAEGIVTGTPPPDNPANLNFTLKGASSGSIRVQVFDGLNSRLDETLTVTPSIVKKQTEQTPAVTSGSSVTLDLTSETDTTLTITPNTNIPQGSSVTVTQYSTPPTGSTSPSDSVYRVLGRYLTIESPDLSGKVSSMTISFHYTNAEIAAAMVAEDSLRVYYYNPSTGAWEALPGGVDTTNNIVWGTTTHLSIYGIFMALTQPSGGGGGGGGGGGYAEAPIVTAAPFKTTATPTVIAPAPTTAAPIAPVAEVTTIAGITTAPTVTQAATATATPRVPLTPLPGILGAILAGAIFVSLRKR